MFLHPETNEEYALARTERKTAPGYKGFVFHAAPDVTLEADLARRDLTINAMALDEDGRLIDPHNGARDLRAGILRHVSPAFVEDPVRILRLARFAARFPEFRVAPETAELVREMVRNGEADALVPERVMQELSRGLMERRPSRMLQRPGRQRPDRAAVQRTRGRRTGRPRSTGPPPRGSCCRRASPCSRAPAAARARSPI